MESRIWPGASGPVSTSSSPVEQHADARRAGTTRTSAHVEAREHAEVRGREHGARLEHDVAGVEVAAGAAHVQPRFDRERDEHAVATVVGVASVRSTITIASAPSGIGAPVMMRIASPAPTATVGA